MKTKECKTENRNSKMKNAVLKGGAIIISFILISFTVSAQNFWKQLFTESSLSNVAVIMAGKTGSMSHENIPASGESTTGDESFRQTYSYETDQPLALEDWMTNESFLNNFDNICHDADQSLEIEDWMINSKYFENEMPAINHASDNELKLEDWMVDSNLWNV